MTEERAAVEPDSAIAERVGRLAAAIAVALAGDPHPCAAASARWLMSRAAVLLRQAAGHLGGESREGSYRWPAD